MSNESPAQDDGNAVINADKPGHQATGFLDLPLEIRCQIYDLYFLPPDKAVIKDASVIFYGRPEERFRHAFGYDPGPLEASFSTRTALRWWAGYPVYLDLLWVSSRIRNEAKSRFWRKRFCLDYCSLEDFLRPITAESGKLIKSLVLFEKWYDPWDRWKCNILAHKLAKHNMVNLKSLEIRPGCGCAPNFWCCLAGYREPRTTWAYNFDWDPRRPSRSMADYALRVAVDFKPWLKAVGKANDDRAAGTRALDVGQQSWLDTIYATGDEYREEFQEKLTEYLLKNWDRTDL